MGTLLNRRRYMGGGVQPYTKEGYIQKGLIFHLDGLNDGGVGGHWIDIVQGADFSLTNVVKDGDGFLFADSNSTAIDDNPTIPTTTPSPCTTEFVMKRVSDLGARTNINESTIFGTKTTSYGPWLRINAAYSSGTGQHFRFFTGKNSYRLIDISSWPINMTCSISENGGFVNFVENELSMNTSGYGNPSNCSIKGISISLRHCAIRIYDRPLSKDEVLHNQQVDNQRFNLGLNI